MSNPYIPNSAPIPNILFDYWMAKLNGSAFKILMAIARKTYGWHKQIDAISVKQLEDITGLARRGIFGQLEELVELGIVIKIKSKTSDGDDAPNQYTINIDCAQGEVQNSTGGGAKITLPVVQDLHQGVVQNLHPQKTLYTKDTIQKREADKPPPPASPKKKEKPKVEKTAYRDNVFLTEQEYQKLLEKDGLEKLNWKLDCLHAKKGAKDYDYKSDFHVLLPANWVEKEYLAAIGKIPKVHTVPSEVSFRNKKISEFAETKLNHQFTGHVFFQAGPEKAVLVHRDKDIKKEFEYDSHDTTKFKEILMRELESCFPRAREILTGQKSNSVAGLINDLATKFKVAEVN